MRKKFNHDFYNGGRAGRTWFVPAPKPNNPKVNPAEVDPIPVEFTTLTPGTQ